jgi:hypothetical protein
MTASATDAVTARAGRRIGLVGTLARLVAGALLVGSVVRGHWVGDFHLAPWLVGLVGFPVVVVGWQWWRSRRRAGRLQATGPVGHTVNLAVVLALYLTPQYAPALSATSDAALLFYGTSMLLAAARGYAGCEVLAVSNWLLRRDDQIGCVVFSSLDHLERRAQPAADRAARV